MLSLIRVLEFKYDERYRANAQDSSRAFENEAHIASQPFAQHIASRARIRRKQKHSKFHSRASIVVSRMAPPKSASRAPPPPGQRPISAFFGATPKRSIARALDAADEAGDVIVQDAPVAREAEKTEDARVKSEDKAEPRTEASASVGAATADAEVDIAHARAPAEVSTPPEREVMMDEAKKAPARTRAKALQAKAGEKRARATKSSRVYEASDEEEDADESGSEFEAGEEDDEDDDVTDEDMSEEEEESEDDDFSESESPVKKKAKKPVAKKATGSTKSATTTMTATANARGKTTMKTTSTTPAKATEKKVLSAADVLAGGGPEQYDAREKFKFPFLLPENIKDARGRRPSDADYDPSTLLLPSTFPKFKDASGELWLVSPGQQQWWKFKAANFDSVMLFKMGKFYEMYEMDAHVGVRDLGLIYMRGEQPHAGFPEKNYAMHAEQLARNGHRVVCIEQTETPAQLAERKKSDPKCKDTVVRREMVQVLTKGTMIDMSMLDSSPDAAFVCAVIDGGVDDGDDGGGWIGLCAADCGTGRFLVGAWRDDEGAGCLRTALAELRPVEILVPHAGLSPRTKAAVLDTCPSAQHRAFKSTTAADALHDADVEGYFKNMKSGYPAAIKQLRDTACDPARECGLGAWGTVVAYLRAALIDADLVPQGRVEALRFTDVGSREHLARWAHSTHVAMDAAALSGLEVLENTAGGTAGTLLASLDRCVSGPGRRLLRQWICRPLTSAAAIRARQVALSALRGAGVEATGMARKLLRDAPDTERAISRVVGTSSGKGRDAAHVVLYEDSARAKLNDFLAALQGVRAARDAAAAIAACANLCEKSPLLKALCVADCEESRLEDVFTASAGASMPDLSALKEMEAAFDWAAAKTSGRIEPARGVDADLDASDDQLAAADADLAAWLEQARVQLGGHKTEVCFVTANKDTHLVELPDRLAGKVPTHWVREGKRKGFERFTCDDLVPLREARVAAQEARESALSGVFRRIVAKFCEDAPKWQAAASIGAIIDVLGSLAVVSEEMYASCGAVCTPKVLPAATDGAPATLVAEKLSHPCASSLARSFVPNDARLGGDAAGFCLLTGPNMGGKSTYLRQVCLAAIMAHVGADVPAAKFEMTAMDAVFVRMGAKDNLAGGQSTFMVELSETGAMLRRATTNSLVALDELGRGTATADGAAIACAVASHLIDRRCRTLFSTHYHRLADDHARDPNVALAHMGCRVEAPGGGAREYGRETVTFLYTLTSGACPRSYGVNVARLAGLPESVCVAAAARAAHLERNRLEPEPWVRDATSASARAVLLALRPGDFPSVQLARARALDALLL